MDTFSDEVLVEYRVLIALRYWAFSSCVLRYFLTTASRLANERSLCGESGNKPYSNSSERSQKKVSERESVRDTDARRGAADDPCLSAMREEPQGGIKQPQITGFN